MLTGRLCVASFFAALRYGRCTLIATRLIGPTSHRRFYYSSTLGVHNPLLQRLCSRAVLQNACRTTFVTGLPLVLPAKVFPCDQIYRQEHKNIQSTNSTLADKTLHFACKTLRCSNQKPLFCSHNSWPRNSQSLPARLLLLMKTWKTHRNV